MPVPFKEDPREFRGRKLFAQNVFDLLPKDHDCFIYEDIFSQIDTKALEEKYSMLGQHAYHPKLIVAILIYAYSQGIYSSRKIEKKCKEDLSFMYISHLNCPNFRVLSDFRKKNLSFFVDCFKISIGMAKGLGMVALGHVALDGSKFFADTSKHKAASYSHIKANEKKLEREIRELLKKADDIDTAEDKIYHNGTGYSIPDDLKIKEKRLEKIKKVKKKLEEREKKENPGKKIDPKKQISYADTDARIMKKGKEFSYCYNAQISVDSKDQIIVGQHLSQNANDKNELKRAIDEIEKNTGSLPGKVSADSGYRSSENISKLKDSSIDGYIATGKGEKDPEVEGKIGIKNFSYDEDKDVFVCPAGQILEFKSTRKKRIYKASGVCRGCVYRKRCAACKKDNATVYIDDGTITLAAMAEKMRKNSSRQIYRKRKIIVEPVFGQIKTAGFLRFSLRGYEKAGGEFSLVCAVLNFKKIVKKIKSDISMAKKSEFEPAVV
jgi:transposase